MTNNNALGRLWNLEKRMLGENSRFYLSFAAAMLLCTLFFAAFPLWNKSMILKKDNFLNYFFFFLFIFGFYLGSKSFSVLNNRKTAVRWQLLPATSTEKFWSVILIHTFLFFIVYLIWETFLIYGVAHLYRYWFVDQRPGYFSIKPLQEGSLKRSYYFIVLFFSLQSYYIFCSLFMRKHAFFKATICLFAGLILFLVLYKYFITHNEISLSPGALYVLLGIWCPLFLAATWWKLKKKQLY